jgi:transposase
MAPDRRKPDALLHRRRVITSIPGIKSFSAHVIVSEIGIDMSRFPSAAHLISWARGIVLNPSCRRGGTWSFALSLGS